MADETVEVQHELVSTDSRVGHLNEDQSVKRWPAKRIDGTDFNRRSGYSTLRVNNQYFIVVPPNSKLTKAEVKISEPPKPKDDKAAPSVAAPVEEKSPSPFTPSKDTGKSGK